MTEQQASEVQETNEQAQEAASQADENQASSSEEMIPKSVLNEKNKENKSLRDRLRALEKEQKKREDAEKSQVELLSTENEGLKDENSSLKTTLRRFYFNEAISIPNAHLAYAAANDAGIEVQWDEHNRPKNAPQVAKELQKLHPGVFGTKGADAGDGGKVPVQTEGAAGQLAGILGLR